MKKHIKSLGLKTIFFCLLTSFFCPGTTQAADFNKKEEDSFYVAVKAFEDGFTELSLTLFDRFLKAYIETDKKIEAVLYMGQCYFLQEKYIKALDQFEAALKMEGSSRVKDKILFWLGEIYVKGRDYKRAITFYEELIRDHANSFYFLAAHKSLAGAWLKEGKNEEALKTYRKMLERFQDEGVREEASFGVCNVLYRMKDYASLKKEIASFPSAYPQSKLLGSVYFFLGEAHFYTASYEEAIEAYGRSENHLQPVAQAGSGADQQALARLGRGWSYLKLKRYDEAEKIFAEISDEGARPAVALGKAVLATVVGEHEKALSFFDAVIAQDASGEYASAAYVGKAEIYYGLSRFNEAVVAYRTALDKLKIASVVYEEDARQLRDKIYYGLAWAYLKVGDFRAAQGSFEKMVLESSDKAARLSALCQLGDTYQDAGDYKKAIETYQNFFIEYPESIYSDYIQYQLGMTWLRMNSLDSAVLALRKVLKEYSSSKLLDDANYFLGVAYFQKENFAAAAEQLARFFTDFKDSEYRPQALFLQAEALLNIGDYRAAADAFNLIAREYPQEKDLCQKAEYEAAAAYDKMGQHEQARRAFADFITRHPDSPFAPDVIFWLGERYLEKKNFTQARTYFEKFVRGYPRDEQIAEAYLRIGLAYLEEGDHEAALRNFRQMASAAKNEALVDKANLFSGEACFAKQDFEKALEFYRLAARGGAATAKTAYVEMSRVHRLKKSAGETIAALENALSLEGSEESSDIQFQIAELLEEDGRRDEALEAYLKVFYLYPKDEARAVKALLRAARIYEEKESWVELKGIFEKIAGYDLPEAKFAKEKLEWLRESGLAK